MNIHKSCTINAPRDAVWAALTDPETIMRWGAGPALMAAVPGFEFSLWNGDIHGKVLEVDPGRSMLQEWYGGDWEAPSLVSFALIEEPEGATRLELENTGVPHADGADIDAGWDDYYLRPIKELLEGGDSRA